MSYIDRQRNHYNLTADEMRATGNHAHHNKNPDYWDILLKDVKSSPDSWKGKRAFDFGCGQGRNIINLLNLAPFSRVDGGDISKRNIDYAVGNITKAAGSMMRTKVFVLNGTALNAVQDNFYDFLMSTIVLQHIPVYDIRFGLLKEFHRVLKPGGLISLQMGYDKKVKEIGQDGNLSRGYYDNDWDAGVRQDVSVTHSDQLKKDLIKVGFTIKDYDVVSPFSDQHDKWIYIKAKK